jgi:GNAT superfamily N-acetyltransferase
MVPDGGTPTVAIVPMDAGSRSLYNSFPSEYDVSGELRLIMEGGSFRYEIVPYDLPVAKTYHDDLYQEHQDGAVFFAMAGTQCVGQIHAYGYWNGMAYIGDIRVRREFRMQGIGRSLMDAVALWAKEKGFEMLRLETQNTNTDACTFYAHYGFRLMGADRAVYHTTPSKGEIALYWYYPLVSSELWE